MDNKEFKPAVEPYVRTRRSAAARAAAAQAQSQNPGQQAATQYIPQEQAKAAHRRSEEQALTAPAVYEPGGWDLCMPSVKSIEFRNAGNGRAAHSMGRFIFFSILLGIASGILLLVLHEQNQLLGGTDIGNYDEVGMTIHCLIWGGVLGLVYGLVISNFLRKVSDSLPLYAMLLFLPVLLFMITPLLAIVNELIKPIIYVLLYFAAVIIGLFFVSSFLCG